jgi:hypothetical protein
MGCEIDRCDESRSILQIAIYHTHLRHIFSQNERMIQSKTDTVLVANPRPRASPDAAPLHGLPADPLQGFTLCRWH